MKKSLGKRMVLLIALLVISVIGFSQKKQWPKTFLWRISGNGLSKPSFLYGTIHLSDKSLFHFGDSLYRYLEQAEGFDIEIDADTLINASVRKWTQGNNGKLLKALMDRKEYEKYADKLSKTLGKPADKITTKDVWVAKNKKTAEALKQGGMQSFMDLYLYGIAKKQGKTVGGIEDVEDQMSIIDNLFDEADVAYLTSDTLQHQGVSIVERMKEIYLQQDLNGVESLMTGLGDQNFKTAVLTTRNLKMARRMDSLARHRSSFFAVGVAHLPGDTGVITLLKKRGFTVEPVFSSKKIAPENYTYKTIEIPWVDFTHDLHLYQVEAPGILQPMDVMKEVMDMKYYYDVSNEKVYYTAVVNSVADLNKKDSVFAGMISRMAANRTIISQKNIAKQNYEGRDVILKATENQLLHLNVYLAGSYAYIAMILCKKTELNDKDSKRFFESFTMTPAAPLSKPYINFTDPGLAFSVRLPQQPIINEQPAPEDEGGDLKTFSASDFTAGSSYVITVRNTKAGNYIPDDNSYLARVRTNLSASMKEDTVITRSDYSEYPSLRMNGTAKDDNVYYQTLTVLRGNRSYFLITGSKKLAPALARADSFFRSFTFLSYNSNEWTNHTAPDHSFSGWLPGYVEDKDEVNIPADTGSLSGGREEIVKKEFLYYDKSTGTSYNVEREAFSEYYFSVNDSSFFAEAGAKFKTEGDTVVSFTLVKGLTDKAADITIERPNSSIIKKLRFILHGDTLYKVFTYVPRRLAADENTRKFFDMFSITSTTIPTTLFQNKTERFIADLSSSDSISFYKAATHLHDVTLNKTNLQAYYPLLTKPLKDFHASSYNANNNLVRAVADIADSSTVDFIYQHYQLLRNEQPELQYYLLKLLVRMNQPYASEVLEKLLQLPHAPSGDPDIFSSALRNDLPLAKRLSQRILSFTKDTAAAASYAFLVKTLLDSGYITSKDILPYLNNFIAAAAQLKTHADEYNYKLINVLHLFGVFNTTVSNAKLLEYSKDNNLDTKYTAVCLLIKNKQPLPVAAINKLAAADLYRTDIYDTLQKVKKLAMFPVAQQSQKLFATSYLRNFLLEDDYEIINVKFIMEKTAPFAGKKQKFYLFRVSYQDGEDTLQSLGIAGPFAIGTTPITSTSEATGVFWDRPYSVKEVSSQFTEYVGKLEEE